MTLTVAIKLEPAAIDLPQAATDNWMLPRTRQEARTDGSKTYFTGLPCKRGHFAPRYTSTCICIECSNLNNIKFKEENEGYHRRKKAEFRTGNPGVHAARARDYRSRNPAKVRETERRYRENYPLIARAKSVNRRARKKKSNGTHAADDLATILKRQGYKCACCGVSIRKKDGRHVDHIIPLAKGGSNDKSNIQFLCAPCNYSKSDKWPEDFMRSRGFLI